MLVFEVIGNLGADARVEEVNGRKFVSFNVADSQRWQDAQGNQRESVQWVSCAMDGDGGNLLPHLKSGRLVYVVGRGSARCFSSPKTRRWEAGLNLSVMRVELLGAAPDAVPRNLYDADGVMHRVTKYFNIDPKEAKELGAKKDAPVQLLSSDGRQFLCDYMGWLSPLSPTPQPDASNEQANG